MKFFLALAFILLAAAIAMGQSTGPVTTASRYLWDMPTNVLTVTDAQSFTLRVKDSMSVPVTELTGFTCTQGTPIACIASPNQANIDSLNRVGVHNLTVALFRADVGESPYSLPPFVLRSPAGAPTNFRLTP